MTTRLFLIALAALMVLPTATHAAPAIGCRQWTWSIPVDYLGPDTPEVHGCTEAPPGRRQSWINDTGVCAWHARKAVRNGATTFAEVEAVVAARGCTFVQSKGWEPAEFTEATT